MNLSARHIRAFLALSTHQHFTRAANACNLSQPAFSVLIRTLEDMVGLKLFDRSTRQVLLTREGERFLVSARRLAAEFEACEQAMRDTAAMLQGRVSVALLPSLAAGWLPQVLTRFLAQHPGVSVQVLDVLSEPCVEAVTGGQADFALAALDVDASALDRQPFCRDGFSLICPHNHPLAQQPEPGASDLLAWPLVHLSRHISDRQYVDAAFFPHTFKSLIEVERLATVIGLVRAGLGISVLPTLSLAHFDCRELAIRALPLPQLTRHIHLIARRDRSLPLPAQALRTLMIEMRPGLPADPAHFAQISHS